MRITSQREGRGRTSRRRRYRPLGGVPSVPFKSYSIPGEPGSLWERMFGYFQFRRDDFLKHYHKRSNIEATISLVKARFGDGVQSKTDVATRSEVYCKLVAHNLSCLVMEQYELGIEPVFWGGDAEPREVLRMPAACRA